MKKTNSKELKELKELRCKISALAEYIFDHENETNKTNIFDRKISYSVQIIEMLKKIDVKRDREKNRKYTTYVTESGRKFQVIEDDVIPSGLIRVIKCVDIIEIK